MQCIIIKQYVVISIKKVILNDLKIFVTDSHFGQRRYTTSFAQKEKHTINKFDYLFSLHPLNSEPFNDAILSDTAINSIIFCCSRGKQSF